MSCNCEGCRFHASLDAALAKQPSAAGEVGTGAGEVAPGQDTGSAWVTRSTDCPEAPAQAHLPIFLPGARIPTLLAALFVLTVAVVFVGAVVAGGVG
jgi:hypothetical protein